jgi:hypothetical protein
MLSCSLLNFSTIPFMKGPSPPVKPFQKDSSTLGPVVGALAISGPAAAGESDDPPPQAETAAPTPTAAPSPSSPRRDISSEVRSLSLFRVMSFLPEGRAVAGGLRGGLL